MNPGPVMLDVAGLELRPEEKDLLRHPATGGIILFSRNYENSAQVTHLIRSLRAVRPELLVAVDHEGGRVQRFRAEMTAIPAMGSVGALHEQDPARAEGWATDCGTVLAWELTQLGVDFSFTPVLDLDYGRSAVIGNRSLHREPTRVCALARALVRGLRGQGMSAVVKHFPGHGHVTVDSHLGLPVDERTWDELESADLIPFRALLDCAGVGALMPAHVLYSAIAPEPAGFSPFWLQTLLRQRWGFEGMILSDDLTMGGAVTWGGGAEERTHLALDAGCDAVLVCNDVSASEQVLESLERIYFSPQLEQRWMKMRATSDAPLFQRERDYHEAHRRLQGMEE
ncbi:beta-N-acetylhexosaminidase [Ferrovum myxofaciens]|uniref:Beta-hexosaminidase n=2 Tax=root TaxID=1 RepID=A0A9E6MXM9_9PROT|nr:beta-N-acetylhexosaminidase [Ferrovum myxofaciens]QKE37727.1 MAG: beta-N-acetylhexosaminidase [Ferrovum myxofaciens]QKE40205.1 MAG: beta-N-acetylhexosaminidase [Ferrovum myxofaciens]QWY75394.1 MAG: beta-N-acetylhexosaminidase [Ferrovum myxofaciens]QWY78134.1 MAG: beta-N-acetylhexosaminidase [Ferrovum myxofaciens]